MGELGKAIWRGIRVALAFAASTFLSKLAAMPELIWAAPAISAVFKYIRDKFPKLWWIPL